MTETLNPLVLIPIGRSLLLASFAYSLFQSMRGQLPLAIPFERLLVAFVALLFFQGWATGLRDISGQFSDWLREIAPSDLKAFLLELFEKAAREPGSDESLPSLNLPALLEQAWRTGVWGVMSALVEGTYLIVTFVLECAREVLWELLVFLIPLACGVFPVFPRILSNMALYAVELSLWMPMLTLVERATGVVARTHVAEAGSWGLSLLAVQVVAILLMLLIPTMTHRFLSGAFSGDFNSQQSLFVLVQRFARGANPVRGGGK